MFEKRLKPLRDKILFTGPQMKEFKKYLAQAESYLEQGNTIEATRSLGEAEEIVETALQRRWGDDRAEKKQMFEEHLKPLRDKIETKD